MDGSTRHSPAPATTIPPDDPGRTLTIARPNEDPNLPYIGLVGDTYTILLTGKDTAGRYCLIDMHVPPCGVLDPECPLFLSRKTRAKKEQESKPRAISRQQIYHIMTVFYAQAGLVRDDGKALATHTLRKTFCMRIYDSTNHNIFLVSKAVGHASVDMTQKYLGISDEEVADAILNAA